MNLSQHTKEHKPLNDSAMNQAYGSVCSRFLSLIKTDSGFRILALSLVICTFSFFAAGFIPEEKYKTNIGKIRKIGYNFQISGMTIH